MNVAHVILPVNQPGNQRNRGLIKAVDSAACLSNDVTKSSLFRPSRVQPNSASKGE